MNNLSADLLRRRLNWFGLEWHYFLHIMGIVIKDRLEFRKREDALCSSYNRFYPVEQDTRYCLAY
ncbi:hypothetical protein BpHYR1_040327 [Brachionus plicatilis]|uniref:Uncharacterized protein n=1 Tax=Brachionus plicatilis TaxID=10195 RepID=A0A3M7P3N4_BRAPC|nr:hypothetical protein BpHYR1_040327 [Brachionus plicatilis]